MLKRLLALVLAMVLCLGALAGCSNDGKDETTSKQGTPGGDEVINYDGELLFEEPFYVECVTYSVTDAERNNSFATQAIKTATNVHISYKELDNFDSQYALMLTDQDVPDLSYFWSNTITPEYGPKGVFINLTNYLDKMPNVKKAMENFPEAFTEYIQEDGAMYALPAISTGATTCYQYIYRADILEKNNLKWATNQEEFYQLLKDLKKIYPNSYPFCLRDIGNGGIRYIATHWGANMTWYPSTGTYVALDHETGEFALAETSKEMRECVTFINKLIDEGLMLKTSLTLDTDGWQTAFATDKCFITYDKLDRLDVMNPIGRDENPDFKLVGGATFPMGSNGTGDISRASGATSYSFAIGRDADVEKMVKFMDWMYSDTGVEVTNWGLRGKHFSVEDGKNVYSKECYEEAKEQNIGVRYATAFGYPGLCGISDYEAFLTSQDEDTVASYRAAEKLQNRKGQPVLLEKYTDSEQMILDMYGANLQSWARQTIAEFMSGERDTTDAEWNWFVNEIEKRHVKEVVAATKACYTRVKAAK